MKPLSTIMAIIFALSMLPFVDMAFAQETEVTELIYEDIQPYTGSFGPDTNLYGVKLMLERIDEALTFDPAKKVEKKLNNARTRLAEAKGELLQNRVANAEKVMNKYMTKMNEAETELYKAGMNADAALKARLEKVQIKAEQHKLVLQGLISQIPETREADGLYNALDNAIQNAERLETRFESQLNKKIEGRLNGDAGAN